jgi:hypothetical protein
MGVFFGSIGGRASSGPGNTELTVLNRLMVRIQDIFILLVINLIGQVADLLAERSEFE